MPGSVIILTLCLQFTVGEKKENEKIPDTNSDTSIAILNAHSDFSSNAHTASGCIHLHSKNGTKNLVPEGSEQESVVDLTVCFSRCSN
ncbi:hypothetical protein CNR22_01865 [Sphingobacteriaceae bacterium]|nr:hypothetical protein CNR22_01865 [Sphingobacteriaceae bacterium]